MPRRRDDEDEPNDSLKSVWDSKRGKNPDPDERRPRRRREADEEPDSDRVPTRATYLHRQCGEYTQITEEDFKRLADPFEFVPSTVCAGCGASPGLGAGEWVGHPDKSIREWRSKMRAKAPGSLMLVRWFIGPLLQALIGLALGLLFSKGEVGAALVGAVTGAIAGHVFLSTPLSWALWSDYYARVRRSAAREPREE